MSWMSAQANVFDAFPLLRAAYMSQARAIPPDLDTAAQMLSLANQGYGPAQTTIQAFLAAGNHPSAGAQNSGGVADGMLPVVYDYFVTNYAGPLSPAAAAAVANRGAYNAWVQRIAAWPDAGPLPDEGAGPGGVPGTGHVRDIDDDRSDRGSHNLRLLTPAPISPTWNRPFTRGRFRVVRGCSQPAGVRGSRCPT